MKIIINALKQIIHKNKIALYINKFHIIQTINIIVLNVVKEVYYYMKMINKIYV